LKVFEGIPHPYDAKKRMVVPEALKVVRIKSHRNTCLLGELSSHFGWEKKDIVRTLEEKRKAKSEKYWQTKQKKVAARAKAMMNKDVAKVNNELKAHGF